MSLAFKTKHFLGKNSFFVGKKYLSLGMKQTEKEGYWNEKGKKPVFVKWLGKDAVVEMVRQYEEKKKNAGT